MDVQPGANELSGAEGRWLPAADVDSRRVPTSLLLPADSPRLSGEDEEHARMLAELEVPLPPIIVHRSTMRVIDGMHRLRAAALRGDETIEVRFFDGTDSAAFLLAVQSNIEHGRPLSPADRHAAAERIVATHSSWSDRAIAAAAGLGTRTVAEIRRQLADATRGPGAPRARQGRDGRWRPINPADGRHKAENILRAEPSTSMREVARRAGISPATALDVRNRLRAGADPVQPGRPGDRPAAQAEPPLPQPAERALDDEFEAMLRGLANDPSLRFSESGRDIVRWMLTRLVRPSEWQDLADIVPSHCRYILVTIASQCADEWRHFADTLEQRVQASA
ncbi:ParB N-terminal domain-containing protein [Dactylosporangium vinaceum]|uniref:ParB and winged helix-turn-helix domain-containing protein n=1 Tax=Dactylosporangium vinaceum TaxID=53362 RepID=A0ABV5MSY1_9ACTN|nr:ParB N-terminal domain-containing protein [Dactylosporangium vinaceum]UAB99906.1 ParB N-terminal domain-containing protein [Dactylosporangium vinaceum]